MSNDTKSSTTKLWTWFTEIYNDFGENFENEVLLNKLDEKILSLGDFVWEVGPGIKKDNMLVISPGGDLDLLSQTKEIVSYAIPCDGWEFYYAKQPKQWEEKFIFQKDNNQTIEIDCSSWQYVLLKYQDGMFEIIIKAPNITNLNFDEQLSVSEILLDGVLGEELRMLSIADIDVVNDFEEEYKGKGSIIQVLKNHLLKLRD
ncbi:hypothetical protein [Pedobacter nototheniae]|uniref:hypothetical protein n=1 Tax=Pedobacter nototheniae TaxID=2488994 RepID=UPI00103EAA98|nr:hypothetical protein [Pedobacter nototheniae]